MAINKSSGYDPGFLGAIVPLPDYSKMKKEIAFLKNSNKSELKYTHFSCVFHRKRMLPLYTSVNIRGKDYKTLNRGSDKWNYDNRIEEEYQLGKSFYSKDNNTFDYGHMVRRMDPSWGSKKVKKRANDDTFFLTNCAPQHANLNRKIWQELERHILEKGAKNGKTNVTVFTGPVLNKKDKVFKKLIDRKEIKIPIVFWKIIVWKKDTDNKLYAVGFMQSQLPWIKTMLREQGIGTATAKKAIYTDDYFEHLEFKNSKTYQTSIRIIEKNTGLKFKWKNVKFPYAKKKFNELQRSKINLSKTAFDKKSDGKSKRKESVQFTIKNIVM